MDKPHRTRPEQGMVTAEYAVGSIAACTLASACLYPIFTSPWMRELLVTLVGGLLEPWC